MNALTCPRCSVALRQRGEADATAFHACEACRGVFIDGAELMAVCRTLAHLPDRKDEVRLSGARGTGIPSCPRCAEVPYELEILGELIDFCVSCSGTWIDGLEVEPLAVDLHAKPTRRTGGYRSRVDGEPRAVTHIPCARCKAHTALASAFMTLEGYLCRDCVLLFGVGGGAVVEDPRDPEGNARALAARASRDLDERDLERLRALRAPSFFALAARWIGSATGVDVSRQGGKADKPGPRGKRE